MYTLRIGRVSTFRQNATDIYDTLADIYKAEDEGRYGDAAEMYEQLCARHDPLLVQSLGGRRDFKVKLAWQSYTIRFADKHIDREPEVQSCWQKFRSCVRKFFLEQRIGSTRQKMAFLFARHSDSEASVLPYLVRQKIRHIEQIISAISVDADAVSEDNMYDLIRSIDALVPFMEEQGCSREQIDTVFFQIHDGIKQVYTQLLNDGVNNHRQCRAFLIVAMKHMLCEGVPIHRLPGNTAAKIKELTALAVKLRQRPRECNNSVHEYFLRCVEELPGQLMLNGCRLEDVKAIIGSICAQLKFFRSNSAAGHACRGTFDAARNYFAIGLVQAEASFASAES